jgi:anti-sigma-K factor RskA
MNREQPGVGHSHQEYDELAVGWALKALEPDDESRFARHLPDCRRCSRTVHDADALGAGFAMSLAGEDPPDALRQRIMAQALAEPRQPAALPEPEAIDQNGFAAQHPEPAPDNVRSLFQHTNLLRGMAAAASMALIVGLGLWNVQLQSDREQITAVAEQQAEVLGQLDDRGVYRIAPMETSEGDSVGAVVLHAGGAKVMANGLPVNDHEQSIFVLWGLRDSLSPVPLGTFDVSRPDLDMRPVSSTSTGLDQYDGYAISLEPGRHAPSTPTDTVATGTVGS